ncbi:lipase [Gordonia sp. 852002-50395_SCH5434458]|uniref:Lipase n=1 Tax=Gordonia jacobaea TaxID=122202 RepID=A0ABR5IH65_9ACTN|nr:lipase [Gordonia jacobaea]OBB99467.1 lipase [Gordonia sp. 852002-50395_SCH5434458]
MSDAQPSRLRRRSAVRTRYGRRGLPRGVGVLLAAVVSASASVMLAPQAAAEDLVPGGTVITRERVPAEQLPPGAAAAERVEYVTRDQTGRSAPSSGIYWIPQGTPPPGGWKIVSWAHGTTGIGDSCAPSKTKTGSGVDAAVIAALKAGYAVTATDYAGLGTAEQTEYLGGRAAAHSVLDMLRAARWEESRLSNDWVSMGHSQGGHAALWAGHMAAAYAPELRLHEVVAAAPASGIESVFSAFTPNVPSLGKGNIVGGLLLFILAGLDHARPDLNVRDHLTDTGEKYLELAHQKCSGDFSDALRSVSPGSLVARAFTDKAFTDALADYTSVPSNDWHVPIRIDHGLFDPVVPYVLSASLVRRLRSAGADVSFVTHPRADHTSVVEQSLDDEMRTIGQAFGRD